MSATMKDPRTFFTKGSAAQFEYVLGLYEDAIKLKANQKNRKEEEFLKLDKWYQKELPKKIKSRGKDAHLTHEELCMCMKWKLWRSKFSPRLKDLIQMNTPRLCMAETKKAFRAMTKKQDLPSAILALCNLKGVGPAMASVVLTAGCPDHFGFMADECLMAIPEIEGIDYTTKELINFVEQLKNAANRLNKEGADKWNPHRVELALWTHFVIAELNKELLDSMPGVGSTPSQPTENGGTDNNSDQNENGATVPEESNDSNDSTVANKENMNTNGTGTSDQEDSRPSVLSNCEDTNDSVAISEPASENPSESCDVSSPPSEDDSSQEPPPKKMKLDE